MKVTVKEVKKERNYPYIGKREGGSKLIVLFIEEDKGTVIQPDGSYSIGEYNNTWIETNFVRFEGTVELSND